MMKPKQLLLFLTGWFSLNVQAGIDNRYLPLFQQPYQHAESFNSVIAGNAFVLTARECHLDLKEVAQPVTDMFGKYDLIKASQAVVKIGKANPLPTSWQTATSLVWDTKGKIQGQGVWFGGEHIFRDQWLVGAKIPFMHISSQVEFLQNEDLIKYLQLGANGTVSLHKYLNETNQALGIKSYQWQRTGFGDLDIYLGWSLVEDYFHRFKHFDFAVKVGALWPVNDMLDVDYPTAVPFGGYNHRGVYLEADWNCELKDDWRIGIWANWTARQAKVERRRMAVGKELPQYGALTGDVWVDPGFTFGFAPYIWLTDLQDGLGVRASYTLISHSSDYWSDQRHDSLLAGQVAEMIKLSEWASEYLTLGLIYELQPVMRLTSSVPYLYLNLNVPMKFFDSNGAAKTYQVAAGFEFNF